MPSSISEELKLESLELFQTYSQSGSIKLRNQIVKLNIGLVRKEAHHWVNQCSETYEDLLQIGSIGLIRAIERFEPNKGHAFSSFAIPYIRGEIQHYLRDRSTTVRIPRRWLELHQESSRFCTQFRHQHHRQPTQLEIAQALGIELKEWQEIRLAYQNREPMSLDQSVDNDGDAAVSLADLVPDREYHSFQLAQEDQLRLQQALSQLEERTRRILEFVFLQDLTQKQTAEQLGISVVTVARRVKQGITTLKETMGKY